LAFFFDPDLLESERWVEGGPIWRLPGFALDLRGDFIRL